MAICKHPECSRKSVAKGCCDRHYRRILKNGSMYEHGGRVVHSGNDEERFHKKYEKKANGCWLWQGGTRPNSKGTLYGRHHLSSGKAIGAHRYSYILKRGEIDKGAYICHKCDTPLCVNPDHLFMSDHAGNMKDMVLKGRSSKIRGQHKYWRASLTNKDAENIRVEYRSAKTSYSKLAEKYHVSVSVIGRIIRGESY